jgi:hypothetical protein
MTKQLTETELKYCADNIDLCCNVELCYDIIIVCTGNASQEQYWQARLENGLGVLFPKTSIVLAVHEDWNGGAGNGLGTLYAYKKACIAAKERDIDLPKMLKEGASVALYHTAGKGTRLAPLPGSENNNKPGVQLPSQVELADGTKVNISILEAVIKQTGIYAKSRGGRVSVYWGDQVFIPSIDASYKPMAHADILCKLRPMPTAEEWSAEGLQNYGLIAVNDKGQAAQVEKVTHETATRLLKDGLGQVNQVGTSLGSFSVSATFLEALMVEFASELEAKLGKLDTDPHFWMPLTLSEKSYIEIMKQKGVEADDSLKHFQRMDNFKKTKLPQDDELGIFGAVDVGRNCYWWDYGQLRWYWKNNMLAIDDNIEATMLRKFYSMESNRTKDTSEETLKSLKFDNSTILLNCNVKSESSVNKSLLSNVVARELQITNSLLVNVTAKKVVGTGGILYNVIDDSEDGIVLNEGDVRADIITGTGEIISMKTNLSQDSGKAWKVTLDGNDRSFEDVYKMNLTADISRAFEKAKELHNALREKL